MPNFSTSIEEAESRDAAAKSFNRVDEWRPEEGKPSYLRIVKNIAVPVAVHRFIPTKPKPEDCDWTKWPELMWAVCARDKAFRLRDENGRLLDAYEDGFGDCYIHTAYAGTPGKYRKDISVPEVVSYGLAAVRKIVHDPVTGKPAGFTDDTFEFRTESGETVILPKLVIVGQKYGQFWQAVKAATSFMPPFTMCDRDFMVTKKEKELVIASGDRTPDHQPGTPSWAVYERAIELTGVSVQDYLLEHATHDHYAKFFIPGESPAGGYGRKGDDEESKDAKSAPATTATHPEVNDEAMAAFRESLSTRSPAAEATA